MLNILEISNPVPSDGGYFHLLMQARTNETLGAFGTKPLSPIKSNGYVAARSVTLIVCV